MSTPSESTKPSTTAADNVGKEQHDVPKSGTVEQDTAIDDSLKGSLTAEIASEDHPAAAADASSPTINVVPGADLSVLGPELPVPQDANLDGEVWIPKGPDTWPTKPSSAKPTKPTKPSKPQRDD